MLYSLQKSDYLYIPDIRTHWSNLVWYVVDSKMLNNTRKIVNFLWLILIDYQDRIKIDLQSLDLQNKEISFNCLSYKPMRESTVKRKWDLGLVTLCHFIYRPVKHRVYIAENHCDISVIFHRGLLMDFSERPTFVDYCFMFKQLSLLTLVMFCCDRFLKNNIIWMIFMKNIMSVIFNSSHKRLSLKVTIADVEVVKATIF